MFPFSRPISGHHLRFALYVALSAVSGVAWAGLFVLIVGEGRNHDMPITALLLMGAVSGLLVGLLLKRCYGASDWRPAIYCAPLALWLGAFCFLALVSQFNYPGRYGAIIGAAAYACIVLFPPYLFLMLFSMINGLLLRVVLRCGVDERGA